jgi:hypothetical protein
LTLSYFSATYLAPNEAQSLARFNELVSGYWLGQEVALVVRHPNILALDPAGRLHSATGPCLEYPDGWGFYAWHGVRVPQKIILAPEQLTFQDWREAPNMEVRRVIQERLGEQFMTQVGGMVIDTGPRGTLYEVPLPGNRERTARYVQVQDASTPRQYFLRVPPTIQTAAEAVAWSFGLSVEDYGPAQETCGGTSRHPPRIRLGCVFPLSKLARPVLRARLRAVAQHPDYKTRSESHALALGFDSYLLQQILYAISATL